MIARICGKIVEKQPQGLLVDVAGIVYEVLIPACVMQRIEGSICADGKVSLITYHYQHMEPSRSVPVLIGFLNDVEKEFFEAFITVSGIGPRGALKALNKPISLIAQAIDEADVAFLQSLPGIGQQKAKEIIAKLQNKVGKFGLIKDEATRFKDLGQEDIQEEALAVLLQLGYKKTDASGMIKKAMESRKSIQTTEELLNELYRQKKLR
ncbi:MAG: helix-hairpin-helix domain-containing protein [Candidatus Omnitrophica bacterium]|nr:helix-hairpin-helix domain-containing protein [Candidatus Omnitrophota bacterium]